MKNVADIFELMGGPANLGRAIGVPTQHASVMKRRGSIPVTYWPKLLKAAAASKIRIDADALARVHERRRAS